MKKIIALLLVLVMVLGLAACSAQDTTVDEGKKEESVTTEKKEETSALASTEEELTGTITFAHHRVDLIEETEAVAEAFMKEHPGVIVEVEAVADYAKNMAIRLSAGEVPDVLFMDYSVAPLSTWPQYLQPIDDTRLKGKVQCEDFYTIDGHLYGLQSVGGDKGCFMYNKDLYAQAGITELPTTWAEFEACLEKLSKIDGIIPLTTQYKTGWAIEHWVYTLQVLFWVMSGKTLGQRLMSHGPTKLC